MTAAPKHISVCICTLQRPTLLATLLRQLEQQQTDGRFTFSIVVTDNDAARSSEPVVDQFAATSKIKVTYACEPRRNIALARNEALSHAAGDFIAFIDDDEYPAPDWLARMLETCEATQSAGVLGPVRPYFDEQPPQWIIDGRFCERPEHHTGHLMDWEKCRTGNVLFRRELIAGLEQPFQAQFALGGEDKDFFMRMCASGHQFRWCNEGVVHELVPKERWRRQYMLKRALLRGQTMLDHPVRRISHFARSLVAVPVYILLLPFTLVLGHHIFMKYCIKLCDHGGRLISLLGVRPVRDR